jgi:hypothetical protein
METPRKMVLLPAEAVPTSAPITANQAPYLVSNANNTNESSKDKKKFEKPLDKLRKMFSIALKLALVNGYDSSLSLIDSNGNVVPHSSIELLINHALTQGKLLVGEEEFIRMLIKAEVPPDMIINENVKQKLINYKQNVTRVPIQRAKLRTQSNFQSPNMEAENFETITRVPKRSREQDADESSHKRIATWEIPKSTYPKMVIRRVQKPKKSLEWTEPEKQGIPSNEWVEPEKSNHWRNDVINISDNEDVSDNEEENDELNYDNSNFAMTPSRL